MFYESVLFDLDGTLLNSLEDIRDSVNEILNRYHYPQRTLEQIRSFVGNGAINLIRRALPEEAKEQEIERCLQEYSDYYHEHSRNKTCPYNGIIDLLEQLGEKGIRLGVVSNKDEATVKDLCESYFPGLLSVAVGDSQGYQKKPAPDNIMRAIVQLQTEKETTLYVGDSEVDIETARNCALDSVLVSWGFREKEVLLQKGAKTIIDYPNELLQFLGL